MHKLGEGEQLIDVDQTQYALTMGRAYVVRMVNQGKQAPELLALRDARDNELDKEGETASQTC